LDSLTLYIDLINGALSRTELQTCRTCSAIGHPLYCDKSHYDKIKQPCIIQIVNAALTMGRVVDYTSGFFLKLETLRSVTLADD
jgi:hypothetical protein